MKTRALAAIGAASRPAARRLRRRLAAGGTRPAGGPRPPQPQTLTVLAAASLTETFTALGSSSRPTTPASTVKLNYAGSSDLAQQIVNGAPADVFAAASDATMKTVTDAGLAAGTP